MKKDSSGFTLVELLVVVGIISVLMAVLVVSFGQSREESRDAKRQSDLRNLQSAIELFKNDTGRYPAGCNGPTTSHTNIELSGQIGTAHQCPGGADTQYIIGLAPKYIPALPIDPKLNGNEGYVYLVNDAGTVYKIMALNTVESESVESGHTFFRCGSDYKLGVGGGDTWDDPAMCRRVPLHWNTTGLVRSDAICTNPGPVYALSGGFSAGSEQSGTFHNDGQGKEYDTETVRCY